MTHVKNSRADFSATIALAHLTSLCSTSLLSPESYIPGNFCCVLFPLVWCHLKVNITVLLRKPFPSFAMNNDFSTFDLKMSLPPSNLLITVTSKFKEIFPGGPQIGLDSKKKTPCYSCGSQPNGTLSLGTLLEMQNLRTLPKALLNQSLHFNKTLRWFYNHF